MKICFVIQPFDNDKYEKRFVDIFEPAIELADYKAYRIDKDLSVRVPIEDIERGIVESELCFAEISTDNPNVWYELGFAFACGKDVVMVCSDERGGKYPFDIQHRQVISYKTSSTSDFTTLREAITKKIQAIQTKSRTVEKLNNIPVIEQQGLLSHEIAILLLTMENEFSSVDGMPIYSLKSEMDRAGYTGIATNVGLKTLVQREMVEIYNETSSYNVNEEYPACRLKEKGEKWILSNQDQLEFRKGGRESMKKIEDDLPF